MIVIRQSIFKPERLAVLPAMEGLAPVVATALLGWMFFDPIVGLVTTWWNNPDAGHGLLLVPLSCYLAYRTGLASNARPARASGLMLLAVAVMIRVAGATAAGLTLTRAALVLSLIGLILYFVGWQQLRRWWLPGALIVLSLPIPDYLLSEIALPLQLKASQLGTALLRMRDVPAVLTGNVIRIPGHDLFVTEACSGLRSLTALVSIAVLLGGLLLRSWPGRGFAVLLAVGVAILLNGVRVFLTGFLVTFVGPEFGEGFLHMSEGLATFLVAFVLLLGATKLIELSESALGYRGISTDQLQW